LERGKVDLDGEALSAGVSSFALDDFVCERNRSSGRKPELMNEKGSKSECEQPFHTEAPGDTLSFLSYSADLMVGEYIIYPLDWHSQRKCSSSNGVGTRH